VTLPLLIDKKIKIVTIYFNDIPLTNKNNSQNLTKAIRTNKFFAEERILELQIKVADCIFILKFTFRYLSYHEK
jgi:hypothetical protein